MTDQPDPPEGQTPESQTIDTETLGRALGERYLQYALSTITNRALPDARDGLKPVHRRILYAMRELRLAPGGAFRKSAKIAGDVMGNYHPHGDAAIYDAMARLAQDFNIRYPLVDGQGNFGNIDGDRPAAARYTEARLTAVAEALMAGLDEDAVDFRANYDGTLSEPVVMPAAFPNLLANGAAGIAVGMATNIPPHNIDELVAACLHLLKHPEAADDTLLQFVPGPDFPTGGVLVEPPESIAETYRTGRGSFRLRARWQVEELGRGAWQIVVTEIPYQVEKSKLVEKLAELIQLKKLPILADVRDESAEDIRLVLEPRSRSVEPELLMGSLFRASDLETRFALNMNVLIDGRTPRVCSLKEVLRAFLDHRREGLLRRSRFRLGKIDRRLEILQGFLAAYLNLDRLIEIIRWDEEPKLALMAEDWSTAHQATLKRAGSEADYRSPLAGLDRAALVATPEPGAGEEAPRRLPDGELSDVQAEAILNMRLRSLRRLEEMELRAEYDALLIERAGLEDLLAEPALQWKRIADELKAARQSFGAKAPGGARRTLIRAAPQVPEVPPEAMIEREPLTVICSAMGWIRALKGHQPLEAEQKFKDGDGPLYAFHAETTDKLLLLGSNGRFYTLAASALPGGRGMGEPVRLMVDLPQEAAITALFPFATGGRLLLASSEGDGFLLAEDEALAQTRAGKQALNLSGGAQAQVCRRVAGDHVASVGQNRKLLVFPLTELPEMTRGKGVRLQKFRDGGLSDATTFTLSNGLSWKDPAGRTRTETDLSEWTARRGTSGRMAPRGFPRDNRFN